MAQTDSSHCQMTQQVLVGDCNHHNTLFGGVLLSWVDVAGGIAAARHTGNVVATASMDEVHFLEPVLLGEIVNITAQVTYTGRTSLEVEIVVSSENPQTGVTKQTLHAFVTYVAVNAEHRPIPVKTFVPRTEDEKIVFAEGEARKQRRLETARQQRQKQGPR